MYFFSCYRILTQQKSYWTTQQVFYVILLMLMCYVCYVIIISIFCYPFSWREWRFLSLSSSERFGYSSRACFRFLFFILWKDFDTFYRSLFEVFLCFYDSVHLAFIHVKRNIWLIFYIIKILKIAWNHFNHLNQQSSHSVLYKPSKFYELLKITFNYLKSFTNQLNCLKYNVFFASKSFDVFS